MATVAIDPNDALTEWIEPDGLYEVIDGRNLEKPTGAYENWLAGVFFGVLDPYAEANASVELYKNRYLTSVPTLIASAVPTLHSFRSSAGRGTGVFRRPDRGA